MDKPDHEASKPNYYKQFAVLSWGGVFALIFILRVFTNWQYDKNPTIFIGIIICWVFISAALTLFSRFLDYVDEGDDHA